MDDVRLEPLDDSLSHVRVLGRVRSMDWRKHEAAMQDAVVEVADSAMAQLLEWETLFGDEEDVAHFCRCLAASFRLARKTHADRAELLRTASVLLAQAVPGAGE